LEIFSGGSACARRNVRDATQCILGSIGREILKETESNLISYILFPQQIAE